MKFVNYLKAITGVSIYPLISLAIFVPFFIIMLIWVYKLDKKTITEVEHLPMEDGTIA
ncbi:MAG: CcoQ/FixQ family Cbb3-type cytochrome c oxidase assembly chaperone [Bacteroidia bacterium]|nr:CcoQ/FixQ family Cbb3-type cytochrome c oxidase assembly chaperone [Bacteroidia bacterium]